MTSVILSASMERFARKNLWRRERSFARDGSSSRGEGREPRPQMTVMAHLRFDRNSRSARWVRP